MRTVTHRLLLVVPALIGSSLIVFLLLRLVPGDPAYAILGPNATPQLVAQLDQQLGLRLPIYLQYWHWITGVSHGNFGTDYVAGQSIVSELASRLPVTAELVALALALALVTGIPLGIVAAVRRDRLADQVVRACSVVGIAIPDFALGIILILAFSLALRGFPSSGFIPISTSLLANLHSMILPSVALAVGLSAVLMRITRSAMLEVLDQDFIRFSRATGVGEASVLLRHGLRNAAFPILTVAGMQLGYLLGGTVVIEQVFSLPGIGQLLVEAMLDRDYPVVQATVLILVLAFILINLLVDMLGLYFNPKLRIQGS